MAVGGAPEASFRVRQENAGMPLAYARRAVHEIARLFPASTGLEGAVASKSAVLKRMGDYALLLFATHGGLERDGLRSWLMLAPPDRATGLLRAWEVAEMLLAADLTVLSACESARGEFRGGDGLVGLAWAFRAAGCPSIIGTQWKVEERPSSDLLVRFYRELTHRRKDDALQLAMRAMVRAGAPPYQWAAFQLIGDAGRLSTHILTQVSEHRTKPSPARRTETRASESDP